MTSQRHGLHPKSRASKEAPMIKSHAASLAFASLLALAGTGLSAQTHMGGGPNGPLAGQLHDEQRMPMLNGKNTTPEEVGALRDLFQTHYDLKRTVENLPDGIRTVTTTDNETLRASLIHHVATMITRVEESDDPQIPIQSPTLDLLFEKPELITTNIEVTDTGVIVTQTSDDPEMVAALQEHASEVSDLADRGMIATHEMMMKQHH